MIAENVPLKRPVTVKMRVPRYYFSRSPCSLYIVINGKEKESGSVCRRFNTWAGVFASQVQPVVIRADDIVVGGELRVSAEVNCVLLR